METLTIGKLAKQAGVGIETVRFYERQGLLAPPPRSPSGYRQYPDTTVQHLRFIRRAKVLGFSLREMAYARTLTDSGRIKKPPQKGVVFEIKNIQETRYC